MPGEYANPAREAGDLKDEKLELAYEEGHDADIPSNLGTYTSPQHTGGNVDLEKAVRSNADSQDESTLGEEVTATTQEGETDPNIVDWDGPDDPQNPMNWPDSKKWGIIGVLSAVTLITYVDREPFNRLLFLANGYRPLASSFFAPGVPEVMRSFGETSNLLASFVVSVYILGFAIGPLIIAPMSELYGRMPIYNICNFLFLIFTIACAVSTNLNMLIGFRFLAGCAGSSPLTIGGGTIADLMPREKRAGAMAIWAMGPLIGPVVGPVCGGFLVEAKGWRWVFWILAIFVSTSRTSRTFPSASSIVLSYNLEHDWRRVNPSRLLLNSRRISTGGFFSLLLLVTSRETYAVTILEQKAARLRKETGNPNLRSKLTLQISPGELFKRSIVRPMKMLFLSPIVLLMSIYISINYGILYLLFTTITFVFEGQYHFSSGIVGLSYIGVGAGMLIGMVVLGIMSDKIIKKHQAKGNVKPEHRLPVILTLPGSIGLPIGLFLYGWTTEKKVHWIAPIIGTAFVGLGNLTGMMTVQTYLVDAFTLHAASAIAANTVLRSIFGALLPLSGLSMYDALGLGWGNSLLGFIALALVPVLVLFRYYGQFLSVATCIRGYLRMGLTGKLGNFALAWRSFGGARDMALLAALSVCRPPQHQEILSNIFSALQQPMGLATPYHRTATTHAHLLITVPIGPFPNKMYCYTDLTFEIHPLRSPTASPPQPRIPNSCSPCFPLIRNQGIEESDNEEGPDIQISRLLAWDMVEDGDLDFRSFDSDTNGLDS
ncbi:MFS general substrate transporter [Lindgomyces ingoldianus]|uniref:MFS general substrate transporter n=1 Tax=Lindgomyces ingoldianus TaxID=673940 RepID=A0ACB6R5R5_9PLEO|nr:MFS general substrate transporter [Lindgomyces ingoldianus]KAF2474649.1 MFS general substrate transporter [Lindgomyces ingoldianus]